MPSIHFDAEITTALSEDLASSRDHSADELIAMGDPPTTTVQKKAGFSLLSTYQWGTNSSSHSTARSHLSRTRPSGAGAMISSDTAIENSSLTNEFRAMMPKEDSRAITAGETDVLDDDDQFVIVSTSELEVEGSEVIEKATRQSVWGLVGDSIYTVANHTTKAAGSVIYYASAAVEEAGSRMIVEARASLARSSDVAVLSVAGGAASETLLFAVDRGRILSNRISNMLKGDPNVAQRMHLRRLLASGSWAEFSLKCQFATLPWFDRQLIHITRDMSAGISSAKASQIKSEIPGSQQKRLIPPSGDVGENRALLGSRIDSSSADAEISSAIENGLQLITPSFLQDNEESEFQNWILSEAAAGNDDAEYALAKWFTPPSFTEEIKCHQCEELFGVSRFRHHCRHCGNSFCSSHSSQLRAILKFGMAHPVRVCDRCAQIIDKESKMDRRRWRKQRLDDYHKRRLIPYFEVAVDSGADKAYRFTKNSNQIYTFEI